MSGLKLIAMSKTNLQISLISNRSAQVIYAVCIFLAGINYVFYAKQFSLLLPGFLPKSVFWVYLIAIAFFLAGIAILIDKQITVLASFLLAILLFCLAVGIDLRGIFNKEDEIKYLFGESLFKDIALAAGAVMIANFERERPSRRRGSHRHYSSSKSSNTPPVV